MASQTKLMSLTVIATPIGNPRDIGERALNFLKKAAIIIGEERRVTETNLKKWGILDKEIHLLNEHTTDAEVRDLVQLCENNEVALMSDCGTPGFSDPGPRLIAKLREKNIDVRAIPGASSLMCLLSLSSRPITEFHFRGFLPAESAARDQAWRTLKNAKHTFFIMDTPYRLTKTLEELALHFADRTVLLGLNLTQSDEQILEAKPKQLLEKLNGQKAEFVACIY